MIENQQNHSTEWEESKGFWIRNETRTYSSSGNCSVAGLQYSMSPFVSPDIIVSYTGLYFMTLIGYECIWTYFNDKDIKKLLSLWKNTRIQEIATRFKKKKDLF